MQAIQYSVLSPTGEPVTYDDTLVIYPENDVVSIFGPIFTPRIYSKDMDTLEIASSGKVAVTLGDEHALDMRLDSDSGVVYVAARNGNSLAMDSEVDVSVNGASNVFIGCDAGGSGNTLVFGEDGIHANTARSFSAYSDGLLSLGSDEATGSNSLIMGPDGIFAATAKTLTMTADDGIVITSSKNGATMTIDLGSDGITFSTATGDGVSTQSGAGSDPASSTSSVRIGTSGISLNTVPGGELDISVGTTPLLSSFTDDVDGISKVSFRGVVTDSGFDSDRFTAKVSYHAGSLTRPVHDGAANDSSGIKVIGAPGVVKANHGFFDKSFLWRSPGLGAGTNSMAFLGTDVGYDQESYWDLRGGAFRLTHVNTSSGDELSYAFRINDKDELELVKRVFDRHGGYETYESVSKFGQKRGSVASGALISRNRGNFGFRDLEVADDMASVSVVVNTFNMYNTYDAFFTVCEQSDEPTTAELLALGDAGDPGVIRVNGLSPNDIRSNSVTFVGTSAGAAFMPNKVYSFVAAIRETDSGMVSMRPVRKTFLTIGSSSAFFALSDNADPSDAGSRVPLSISSPSGITFGVNSTEARVAIPNASSELLARYMSDPTIDPTLHPAGKSTASLFAWLAVSYPDLIPFFPVATA